MVDYSFVRFDSPSISLFFTRLCFFLQTFGRRKPKVGVCVCVCVDVAKRAGQVGFGLSQSSLWVNQVAGQNMSFLNGSIGLRVTGRVGSRDRSS